MDDRMGFNFSLGQTKQLRNGQRNGICRIQFRILQLYEKHDNSLNDIMS